MVIVGADAHKRTHTFVAVDELGRKLAEKTSRQRQRATWRASPGPASGRSAAGR